MISCPLMTKKKWRQLWKQCIIYYKWIVLDEDVSDHVVNFHNLADLLFTGASMYCAFSSEIALEKDNSEIGNVTEEKRVIIKSIMIVCKPTREVWTNLKGNNNITQKRTENKLER